MGVEEEKLFQYRGVANMAGMGAWPLPHHQGPLSAAPKACWRRPLTIASATSKATPAPPTPAQRPRACSASPTLPGFALYPPSTPGSPCQHPHSLPSGAGTRVAGTLIAGETRR